MYTPCEQIEDYERRSEAKRQLSRGSVRGQIGLTSTGVRSLLVPILRDDPTGKKRW